VTALRADMTAGASGSGRTFVALAVAARRGWAFVDGARAVVRAAAPGRAAQEER
jgi:hypothetical protein